MSTSSGAGSSVATGREALGAFLSTAQTHLQKVFVVFVLALVGTVWFMRRFGWGLLKGVTTARMNEATAAEFDIIVRSPFDVILLQIKLGLVVGVVAALPVLLYYARRTLLERGQWPLSVSRRATVFVGGLSLGLFIGGITYAYFVFFPVAFNFLTTYTLAVGFQPRFDIVKWTQFILFLTLSFGLAAQLPLAMSALSYTGVVPYEFFREKWRHAVVGIFVLGAFFSPPDPFTQLMWGIPLVGLYVFSLYLTKFVTAIKRGGRAMVRAKLRRNWRKIVIPSSLVAVGTAAGLSLGAVTWLNSSVLAHFPGGSRQVAVTIAPLPGEGPVEMAIAALAMGAVVGVPLLVYYAWPELQPQGSTGDPAELDVRSVDAAGVRAAPVAAFADMSESEALAAAQDAMDSGDDEKARAILDRFDEAAAATADEDGAEESPNGVREVASETSANVIGTLAGEGTDEEELGGYAYDLAFILESLTSKSFRVVAVFAVTTMAVFFALYGGAFAALKTDFLSRLPPQIVDDVAIVALHPVEALLFEVKMSLLAGAIVTLPAVCYYAWPAVEQRFHGRRHEYATDPPLSAIAHRWNRIAATGVPGAVIGHVIASGTIVHREFLPTTVEVGGTVVSRTTVWAAGGALVFGVGAGIYYAWPSVRERLLGESKRDTFLLWAGVLIGGLVVGSALGYAYVAPPVISFLVFDAVQAGMVISYTINDFFWLVFATTAGIGLLADVPVTMWLFHYSGIVSYQTMRERWRGIVFIVFVAAALFTSRSVISMFLFGIPVTMMYWVGLVGLWAGTLPDRLMRETGNRA